LAWGSAKKNWDRTLSSLRSNLKKNDQATLNTDVKYTIDVIKQW